MKGIIFSGGEYPIGSSALRSRMVHDGLAANGIETKLIIVYPPPSREDKMKSEDFVHFMFSPYDGDKKAQDRMTKKISFLYFRLIGVIRGYKFLLSNKDIDFVFLYGTGFLDGFFVYLFCKIYKKRFFSEKNDEIRSKYRKQRFIDRLGIIYENLFDKFILNKVDTLFVVSKYLEDKYKTSFPSLQIKRSVPSYINYNQYREYQDNNIEELIGYDFSPLKDKDTIKILFSGSCIFTNGIFFFMDSASKILQQNPNLKIQIIFLFFKGNVQQVKDYAAKVGLDHITTIYENIYYPYIPAIYKYVDILVLPEMGDIVAKAGFPGKSAEYLASGKAIICTDFSNLRDYFISEYNCLMSPLNDLDAYSKNLFRLVTNNNLRIKLGENAISTARNFFDYKEGVTPIIESI